MIYRKLQARFRLLKMFGRSTLEDLSQLDRPHMADIRYLRDRILSIWPHDEIEALVLNLLDEAKP